MYQSHVASRNLACFAKKDFKQDEEPASSHADSEASPGVHDPSFAHVADGQHNNGA